jgi:hypothetical protein
MDLYAHYSKLLAQQGAASLQETFITLQAKHGRALLGARQWTDEMFAALTPENFETIDGKSSAQALRAFCESINADWEDAEYFGAKDERMWKSSVTCRDRFRAQAAHLQQHIDALTHVLATVPHQAPRSVDPSIYVFEAGRIKWKKKFTVLAYIVHRLAPNTSPVDRWDWTQRFVDLPDTISPKSMYEYIRRANANNAPDSFEFGISVEMLDAMQDSIEKYISKQL